mmetsp:Transcript_33345/g.55178  ORF Transcript_33345/g.55178 Transcript_33345/m.55178 type:complete len:262 (-) Transcript_33345:101-886(-)
MKFQLRLQWDGVDGVGCGTGLGRHSLPPALDLLPARGGVVHVQHVEDVLGPDQPHGLRSLLLFQVQDRPVVQRAPPPRGVGPEGGLDLGQRAQLRARAGRPHCPEERLCILVAIAILDCQVLKGGGNILEPFYLLFNVWLIFKCVNNMNVKAGLSHPCQYASWNWLLHRSITRAVYHTDWCLPLGGGPFEDGGAQGEQGGQRARAGPRGAHHPDLPRLWCQKYFLPGFIIVIVFFFFFSCCGDQLFRICRFQSLTGSGNRF